MKCTEYRQNMSDTTRSDTTEICDVVIELQHNNVILKKDSNIKTV